MDLVLSNIAAYFLLGAFQVDQITSNHIREFNLTEAGAANRTCFSCSLDFRYLPWDGLNTCLGYLEPVSTDLLVTCGSTQLICTESWNKQNGILLTLSRGCTDTCATYCKSTGFGVTKTTCSHCCQEDGCNDQPPSFSIIRS